jgi:GNAT superfamily N-acetyltransferase
MQIRPVVRDDLDQLLVLVEALSRHHGDVPRASLANLEADTLGTAPWVHVLVAEIEGKLAGYVAVLPLSRFQYGQRGIDLHHVFVEEAHRGRGVGGALVAAALALGASLGATYATVTATPGNRAAQEFYASLGFVTAPRFGVRFWTPIPQGTRFA